jgi:histone H3/H4
MARLTITLRDEIHRALKEAAASRGSSIGELVEASLESYGIKTTESAQEIVARARRRGLEEDDAIALAVRETRARRRS